MWANPDAPLQSILRQVNTLFVSKQLTQIIDTLDVTSHLDHLIQLLMKIFGCKLFVVVLVKYFRNLAAESLVLGRHTILEDVEEYFGLTSVKDQSAYRITPIV